MLEQFLISFIILATLIAFIKGKWRYDVVAMVALSFAVVLGLIPLDEIFLGFVHPVVVLVVAMLVISTSLIASGAIDFVSRYLRFVGNHFVVQLLFLMILVTALSAFINSMGALAFIIPIAIRMAKKSGVSLSLYLLPLAFGSHFGGGITLIGSVSNIIISGFRADEVGEPFAFFDFALVALPIAVVSVFFVALIGWRLIPRREDVFSQSARLDTYITELKVLEGSSLVNKSIRDFHNLGAGDLSVLALVRKERYISFPKLSTHLIAGDVLVVEAEKAAIESVISTTGTDIVYKKSFKEDNKHTQDLEVCEVVVPDSSFLVNETAKELSFHHRFGVNLLAVHRTDRPDKEKRLRDIVIKTGDVLVIQGEADSIEQFINSFGLLPLKEKNFYIDGNKENALIAGGLFVLAIVVSAFNIMPTHIAFAAVAIAMIAMKITSPRKMRGSIDFSMIILMAVMIQLGSVFYTTGAAQSLAGAITFFDIVSPQIALAVILLVSIWLSDIMSNVTVAVLLAPVALSVALQLGVSADPFLMAVAIGSGSSYLTPIGHQSNIFVMGMGGYRFSDYWRLGLPLEIITFVLGMLLITRLWAF